MQRPDFLAAIRRSLDRARLPSACDPLPEPARPARGGAEDFARELQAVGASVRIAETPEQAVRMVLDTLRASGAGPEILAWNDSQLLPPGLGSALRDAGFVIESADLPEGTEERRKRLTELARARAGVTGALGGLADTGTLALASGPGRPRLASLLPPLHIAVLSSRAIFADMASFLAEHSGVVCRSSNLVFVTGPSRTADIEQVLTLGVHGPRELVAVILAAPDENL